MNLLAIDTSASACSVALMLNDEILATHEEGPMQQAQKILPTIKTLLDKKNITLNQLDALAFGCGPGSFTGVRIATSVMQGLGFAANLPLIPVSSLAALAQAAYDELGWRKLLVGVDARIQEIYWGAYEVNNGIVELVGKEVVCPPQQLVFPQENNWYGVGSAWQIYREQILFNPLDVDIYRLPMATGILSLAKKKFENQAWISAENASPTYLRDEVAKKSRSIDS